MRYELIGLWAGYIVPNTEHQVETLEKVEAVLLELGSAFDQGIDFITCGSVMRINQLCINIIDTELNKLRTVDFKKS
jgi:hypothetical protein